MAVVQGLREASGPGCPSCASRDSSEPALGKFGFSVTVEVPMSDRTDTERPIITRSFPDRESAERAFNDISARGYKSNDVHVIMSDDTRKRHFGDKDTKLGNKALEGAGVGGAVGGAVGATLVGIAAAAATLTVPGLGLVIAGPLAGALAGGAAGAAAGGL